MINREDFQKFIHFTPFPYFVNKFFHRIKICMKTQMQLFSKNNELRLFFLFQTIYFLACSERVNVFCT